jgi:hypothetical protein
MTADGDKVRCNGACARNMQLDQSPQQQRIIDSHRKTAASILEAMQSVGDK